MTRAASGYGGTLSQWLEAEGYATTDAHDLGDVDRIRGILVDAARHRQALSYSELLGRLGHRFTRPRMRAVCRTLDAIDKAGRGMNQPGLAVLVVRESDRLPGQGWWSGRDVSPTTGPAARAHVEDLQRAVFDYWQAR